MKKLILLLLFIPLVSCEQRMSTEQLAEQIKQGIIEQIAEEPEAFEIEVLDFSLVHKGGNEYKGLLKVKEPNLAAELTNTFMSLLSKEETKILSDEKLDKQYSVDVIYDGDNIQWEIITD